MRIVFNARAKKKLNEQRFPFSAAWKESISLNLRTNIIGYNYAFSSIVFAIIAINAHWKRKKKGATEENVCVAQGVRQIASIANDLPARLHWLHRYLFTLSHLSDVSF